MTKIKRQSFEGETITVGLIVNRKDWKVNIRNSSHLNAKSGKQGSKRFKRLLPKLF